MNYNKYFDIFMICFYILKNISFFLINNDKFMFVKNICDDISKAAELGLKSDFFNNICK